MGKPCTNRVGGRWPTEPSQGPAQQDKHKKRPKILIVYTWPPKVCKIIALMAVILGLGLLFYILLGFRHCNLKP